MGDFVYDFIPQVVFDISHESTFIVIFEKKNRKKKIINVML